jgi:hypothetical protein
VNPYTPQVEIEMHLHSLQSTVDGLERLAARYPTVASIPEYLDHLADVRARVGQLIERLALEKVA